MDKKYFRIECGKVNGGAEITALDNGRFRLDIYDKYGININMNVYDTLHGAKVSLGKSCAAVDMPYTEITEEQFKALFIEKTDGDYSTFDCDFIEDKNVTVQTFCVCRKGVFYTVEIVEKYERAWNGEDIIMYEAWLSKPNYGIKSHITGSPAYQHPTKADFINMVAWNIDDDIRFFEDEIDHIENSYECED